MGGIVETVVAGNTLSMTPETNQSFRINRIEITGATDSPVYATVQIDNTTVGYFRVDAGKWNMLGASIPGKYWGNILDKMMDKKLFKGYPVASGQTFSVTLSQGTATIMVIYDWYAPGDVKSTEQDGSQATDRLMFIYGQNSTTIAAPNYGEIDLPNNPQGTFKFPWSAGFPAAFKGNLIGVFAQPVSTNTYAASVDTYVNSEYLKMILNQEVLFDLQKNGFPLIGTGAAAGSANTVYGEGTAITPWPRDDEPSTLWMFTPEIPLAAGDELDVLVSASSATAGTELAANTVNVGFILMTTKVAK